MSLGNFAKESTDDWSEASGNEYVQSFGNGSDRIRGVIDEFYSKAQTPGSLIDASGSSGNGVLARIAFPTIPRHLKPLPVQNNATKLIGQSVTSLVAQQEWEGYVCDIDDTSFRARLLDITASSKTENEVAEFLRSDVSSDDLDLLKEGAIFRWIIGYQHINGGQRQRVSQIVFRRLPSWTKRILSDASSEAENLAAYFE